MHCHTKEGSVDAKISIRETVRILQEKGYDGMLVTDHDTYGGYRAWLRSGLQAKFPDFVVLKGIEYDTIDAGHIIVVLPDDVNLPILELRGLPVQMLIDIVHHHGGILGPAHPCGVRYQSAIHTIKKRKQHAVMPQFDFVETYNACEETPSNNGAAHIAKKYNKPTTGGSDSHKADCVGLAYTDIPTKITCRNDLIRYIKRGAENMTCGGIHYEHTTKAKLGIFNEVLVQAFWFYNRFGAWLRQVKRNARIREMYFQEILEEAENMIPFNKKSDR